MQVSNPLHAWETAASKTPKYLPMVASFSLVHGLQRSTIGFVNCPVRKGREPGWRSLLRWGNATLVELVIQAEQRGRLALFSACRYCSRQRKIRRVKKALPPPPPFLDMYNQIKTTKPLRGKFLQKISTYIR